MNINIDKHFKHLMDWRGQGLAWGWQCCRQWSQRSDAIASNSIVWHGMAWYGVVWYGVVYGMVNQRPDANPETESTPVLPCSACTTLNCFTRCAAHCHYARVVDSDERGIRANRTQEWHGTRPWAWFGVSVPRCQNRPALICWNCQKRPIFGTTCGYLLCVIPSLCQL